MKGTVVSTWLETSKKLWGEDLVHNAMQQIGWQPDRLFLPTEDIEDKKILQYIDSMSQLTHLSGKQLWKEIGRDNVLTFSRAYPSFFKDKTLYTFLASMYDVHVEVVKRISGARPPKLVMRPISEYDAEFTYDSDRGMLDYFRGLLQGAGEFFHETPQIKVLEETPKHLRLQLHFSQPIHKEQSFPLNQTLGFTRSIAAKIGLLTFVISLLPALLLFLAESSYKFLLLPCISGIIAGISASLLLRPMRMLREELRQLMQHQYASTTRMHTGDEFESISHDFDSYKRGIKAEFTGFRGTSDELSRYGTTFNELAQNIGKDSDEISTVIHEVAEAATHGAENTSDVAGFLHQNMEALDAIVNEQVGNNEHLSAAVQNIDQSFRDVRVTSENLNRSMENFTLVRESVESLRQEAEKIISITNVVAAIAAQTNLLALNASIEASHAGEHGRGFAVVAEEIRNLAEQSRTQADVISTDVKNIARIINEVVSSVTTEHQALGQESTQLLQVVENNTSHIDRVRSVSGSIGSIIDRLRQEMDQMNTVLEKVESLAAMSEENSAATEEINATVSLHNEKLQDMTDKIQHFKKIAEDFSNELSAYKI